MSVTYNNFGVFNVHIAPGQCKRHPITLHRTPIHTIILQYHKLYNPPIQYDLNPGVYVQCLYFIPSLSDEHIFYCYFSTIKHPDIEKLRFSISLRIDACFFEVLF